MKGNAPRWQSPSPGTGSLGGQASKAGAVAVVVAVCQDHGPPGPANRAVSPHILSENPAVGVVGPEEGGGVLGSRSVRGWRKGDMS